MPYKKIRQIIATCDKKGNIIGEIERWKAHEEGILHRAFTVALIYKGSYVVQHRKHPVFDGVFDVSTSSHQIMQNGKLQDTFEAARTSLSREWNLDAEDLGEFKHKGAIYYKAKDSKSIYIEHEYCDIVQVEINHIPTPNYEVAYGVSLMTRAEIRNKKSRIYPLFAPWVIAALEKKLM
ncbi:MAG TPA: hypothetical protein VG965_00955 [Patescibacteria group bacterium]|nr:hypothetical protein [Patescibacteria group bacterium]